MGPRAEAKVKFQVRTDRVKSVDVHPTEPWVLASLFNGHVLIWNYATEQQVKNYEVTDQPVRACKFIARRNQIVCGADDLMLRVYDLNTNEKLREWEAHSDYIRCVAVHPTRPLVVSCGDDINIKMWDWERNWALAQVFEGHTHYVMQVVFSPKDSNMFASGSLDGTIRFWSLNSPVPNFTLEGPASHEKGVNCIDFFPGADKPYLVSGSDDHLVKVWDYQSRTCVQTLEGHMSSVSCVLYHPTLPVILTAGEDCSVRTWHASTFRLESTLSYGLERVWALATLRASNKIAIGFDDGVVLLRMGHARPVMSMDNAGRIVFIRNNEVSTANCRTAEVADDGRLSLQIKELGTCEVAPISLRHSPNGRFAAVISEGEYVIYTALAWRSKAFGQGEDLVWSADSARYAVREWGRRVVVWSNFETTDVLMPPFAVEAIFGGPLLGVASRESVCFYNWETKELIRRVDDVSVRRVFWNDAGDVVALVGDGATFVLRFNRNYQGPADESGYEDAFDVAYQVGEAPRAGCWVGECFVYTAGGDRVRYMVGGHAFNAQHLDRPMYMLGYLSKEGRVVVADKDLTVCSYRLDGSMLAYMTAVVQSDDESAARLLPSIADEHRNAVARFLDSQDRKADALAVAVDAEFRFELAVQLGRLSVAKEIVEKLAAAGAPASAQEAKWKQLGDLALQQGDFACAERAFEQTNDLSGMLLLYTSLADGARIRRLAKLAEEQGRLNVAFACHFAQRDIPACLDVLVRAERLAEAAFLARTYMPSRVPAMVKLWREQLVRVNPRAAEAIADPSEYANLFPTYVAAVEVEKAIGGVNGEPLPASKYAFYANDPLRDLVAEYQAEMAAAAAAAPSEDDGAFVDAAASPAAAASAVAATAVGATPDEQGDDGGLGVDGDDGEDVLV